MDRERRKNLNRMSIHLAAVKLFSEKQYEKVTMAEIAAEAHLTKRTVYKYYPSKISLLSSVFEFYTQGGVYCALRCGEGLQNRRGDDLGFGESALRVHEGQPAVHAPFCGASTTKSGEPKSRAKCLSGSRAGTTPC